VSNSDDEEDIGRVYRGDPGDGLGRGYRGLDPGDGPGSRRLGMEEEGMRDNYLDREEGDDDTSDETFQRARATLFNLTHAKAATVGSDR
jgi:hypothetical protein